MSLDMVVFNCMLAVMDAQMCAAARRRTAQEAAAIRAYMESPDFEQRAALLEPHVRAQIALGEPLPLREIADRLAVPIDVAIGTWLIKQLGIPLHVAIGGASA